MPLPIPARIAGAFCLQPHARSFDQLNAERPAVPLRQAQQRPDGRGYVCRLDCVGRYLGSLPSAFSYAQYMDKGYVGAVSVFVVEIGSAEATRIASTWRGVRLGFASSIKATIPEMWAAAMPLPVAVVVL